MSLKIHGCDDSSRVADYIEALNWINSPSNPYRSSAGVINHSGFVPFWLDEKYLSYGDAVVSLVNATNMPFFTSADNFAADACRFAPNDRAYTRVNKGAGQRVFVVAGSTASAGDPYDYRYNAIDPILNQPQVGYGAGSNSGACVSAYAPAANINFAWHHAYNEYRTGNGTSFAAPEAAGIAARYIAKQEATTGVRPSATQVYDYLLQQSQTPVYQTTTRTYYLCVYQPALEWRWQTQARLTNEPCDPPLNGVPWKGPYTMSSVSNTSDARMLYFDEGVCWAPDCYAQGTCRP